MPDNDVWHQLNELVQLTYSIAQVRIFHSQYLSKDNTWILHVLSESDVYKAQYNGSKELQRSRRQTEAASASAFVIWFVKSVKQGHLHTALSDEECVLRVGEEEVLEVELSRVDDVKEQKQITWHILVQLATDAQNQGKLALGSSGQQYPSEERALPDRAMPSFMQPSSFAPSPPSLTSPKRHRSAVPPAALPLTRAKRKGESLINPRVKKAAKTEVEFEDPPSPSDEGTSD